MPKKTNASKPSKGKKNLKVEDLPKPDKKLDKKDMEKVKGGMVLCRGGKKGDIVPCF